MQGSKEYANCLLQRAPPFDEHPLTSNSLGKEYAVLAKSMQPWQRICKEYAILAKNMHAACPLCCSGARWLRITSRARPLGKARSCGKRRLLARGLNSTESGVGGTSTRTSEGHLHMSSRAGSCRSERARSERARSERASERAGERARGHAVPQTGSGGLTPPGIWGYTGERAHAQQGGGSGLSGLSGPRSLCPRSLCLRSLCPRSLCPRSLGPRSLCPRSPCPWSPGPRSPGPRSPGPWSPGPWSPDSQSSSHGHWAHGRLCPACDARHSTVAGPTVICPRPLGPWSLMTSLRCESQHTRVSYCTRGGVQSAEDRAQQVLRATGGVRQGRGGVHRIDRTAWTYCL